MPNRQKPAADGGSVPRLRALLRELKRAQSATGDFSEHARKEVAAAFRSDELKTVGTSGDRPQRKLGKKKS